jgi:hypothetical protein
MFQFPGFASLQREMTGITASRVAPFGHLGITACVPLPRASRSLPRPSSPPCAQASPTCLLSLDYNNSPSRTTRIVVRVIVSYETIISIRIHQSHDLPYIRCQTALTLMAGAKGSTIESGWTECVETKRLRDAFAAVKGSYSRSVKEVIQPQVPLRLPCYDFAPVTALAFGRLAPGCPGFRHGLRALTASMA